MLQTSFIYIVNFPTFFPHSRSSLSFMSSPCSDILSSAVDLEYEVFKSSKSSNLYKAAVLKKVTTDCAACHSIVGSVQLDTFLTHISYFKGIRDEENSTWRKERRCRD